MRQGKTISPAEVDFWLNTDKYANFIQDGLDPVNNTLVFSIDMVRLSSIRAAISNFVRILTRKNIPVYFNDADANVNFEGKVIYISAQVNSKQDFDCAVGQALHEGADTLKTDFDVMKVAYANIPSKIFKLSDSKNIRRASLESFIKGMCNVVEDRYIDDYIFDKAPGYRGYYVALYEKFWNSAEVDEYLLSDYFRYPSLKSYDYRITNFTNENTDLLALPCLEDIAKIIDISHISRLETTKGRIDVALKVVEMVLDCIDKQEELESQSGGAPKKKQTGLADPNDFFDFGDTEGVVGESDEESEKEEKDPLSKGKGKSKGDGEEKDKDDEGVDVGKKMIKEISDIMNGKNPSPGKLDENDNAVSKISDLSEIPPEVEKQINKVIEGQRRFLNGELPKEQVTKYQKSLLDLIEKHGIILVRVELPTLIPGDNNVLKVDCIVVQKMTKELILSGQEMFPLCGVMKVGKGTPEPPNDVAEAVKKGIQLGTELGRKLQIRAEVHPIKTIRKKVGKINKRQLHEAAFDAEDLFYKINIDEHHDANLHITVDASGSMTYGNKWTRTMTAVVAICKAASMIDNVHITVSFRATQVSGSAQLPYVVLAYDSKVDKFSKVKNLFPYLTPNGCTPEGLAFGAIMDLFAGITPDEEDRYFLNLSDGEPFYNLVSPETGISVQYQGDVGVSHTKSQVDKIRQHGVEILSYFIEETHGRIKKKKPEDMTSYEIEEEKKLQENLDNSPSRTDFRKMYGHSAKFICVDEITGLAKTLNELFLTRKD